MTHKKFHDDVIVTLNNLLEFPEEHFHKVNQILQTIPSHTSPEETLSSIIQNQLIQNKSIKNQSELTSKDIDSISDIIISIHYLLLSSGHQEDRFIDKIKEISQYITDDENQIETINLRVHALIKNNPLKNLVKAWFLMNDHDRVYLSSRIITDIRPIFEDGTTELAKTPSVIIHTIKITTQHNGEAETIHIAADEQDLKQLAKAIERAQNKHKTIKSHLNI